MTSSFCRSVRRSLNGGIMSRPLFTTSRIASWVTSLPLGSLPPFTPCSPGPSFHATGRLFPAGSARQAGQPRDLLRSRRRDREGTVLERQRDRELGALRRTGDESLFFRAQELEAVS